MARAYVEKDGEWNVFSTVVEWRGEAHTISEWADIVGINRSTLNNRYWRGDRGDKLFEERIYKCHA